MPGKKHKKLSDCSHEAILEELHQRQCESDSSAKNHRDFAEYESTNLHKELKRSQKLVYGVDDRQDLYQVSDRRIRNLEDDEDVFVIGHPSGLPLKFANGAQVRDNSPSSFFVANLETVIGALANDIKAIKDSLAT